MVGPAVPGLSGVRIDDHLGFPVAANRQLGYERALFDAGVMVDPNLAGPAEFSVDGGHSLRRPTC